MTQKLPEATLKGLIKNGTMMGGGWDMDGTWKYIMALKRQLACCFNLAKSYLLNKLTVASG